MATMTKGAKVFNTIRNYGSPEFKRVIPRATNDNIQTLSNVLLNDSYQPLLNEFVNNLINRIALTIVRNKSFDNPLAILKKGSVPLGTDIQDIYTNPAEKEQYEYSNEAMAKLLTINDPDTHVAYYRRNRQDLYTKTITREGIQGAFTSWENFEDFISSITQSLYSGNYIDEFKYTKALVDGVYDTGKALVEVVQNPVDEATGKAFVKKVRTIYKNMSFPSDKYNAYSKFSGAKGTITTWTTPDRIVVLVRADVMTEVDVDVLASAFNMEKTDFLGRVIEVDEFESPEVLGIICDESFFQIYDNIFRFDEFYNARTMSWNEYLHAWGTYAVCPFANAVVLATADSKPATAIEIEEDTVEIDLASEPTYENLEITLTPNDTTAQVEFSSSNTEVFTVEKIDNKNVKVQGIATGVGTLTAKTDNGLTATATVEVSQSA